MESEIVPGDYIRVDMVSGAIAIGTVVDDLSHQPFRVVHFIFSLKYFVALLRSKRSPKRHDNLLMAKCSSMNPQEYLCRRNYSIRKRLSHPFLPDIFRNKDRPLRFQILFFQKNQSSSDIPPVDGSGGALKRLSD